MTMDRVLWFEVHRWRGHCWVFVSDHDSLEDAKDWMWAYRNRDPSGQYRVHEVTSLDSD